MVCLYGRLGSKQKTYMLRLKNTPAKPNTCILGLYKGNVCKNPFLSLTHDPSHLNF